MKRLLSTLLVCIMLFSSLASYITLDVFAGSYAAFEYSSIVANTDISYPLNDTARQRLGYSSFVTLKETYDGVNKNGSAILRMEINNTVTFCVQPGVHTFDDVDYNSTSDWWKNFTANHYNYSLGARRMIAIYKSINVVGKKLGTEAITSDNLNDEDIHAIAQLILWEILGGYRNPLTGEVEAGAASAYGNNRTILYDKFYNCAAPTDTAVYQKRYDAFVKELVMFDKIPSFMHSKASNATGDPIELAWNGKRYEATVTDASGASDIGALRAARPTYPK